MSDTERLQVLQMIDSGEVSVEDAIGLMSSAGTPSPSPESVGTQRWLRVRVSNLDTGKNRVSVKVPLNLMKWGLALGSRFAPELDQVDMDEVVMDLDQYAGGRIVEVEDESDNQRVEIYIE